MFDPVNRQDLNQLAARAVSREDLASNLGPPLLPLIDGRPSDGAGTPILCINPSTGEPFAHVGGAAPAEIESAVESGILAASQWRGSSFEERRRYLYRLIETIHEQAETIAGLISLEQGKPFAEALSSEVIPVLEHLKFFANSAQDAISGDQVQPRHPLFRHKQAHYMYDPLGLVLVITPFNIPFALPMIQIGAALAMGNAVLLKPSEQTPLCGLRIGELCQEIGLPKGVVNVLPMMRDETMLLTTHPKIDKIFATGTLSTGQQIMATAGCVPRPVVLALGGHHPSIVAADADLDRAVRGVLWGAFANAGQHCDSIRRVYVEQPIASRFLDRLTEAAEALRLGDPQDGEVDIGPLISESVRVQVEERVQATIAGGAKLLTGGEALDRPGYFYKPTLLLAPSEDSPLLQEETMGPVLPITIVETLEHAVMKANQSRYSLSASGWTRDQKTAERLMAHLHAGTVTINDAHYVFHEPAAIRAGHRMSGIGHVQGQAGLREMVRRRFTSFDPAALEGPLFGFPHGEEAETLSRHLLTARHAASAPERGLAWLRLGRSKRFRSRTRFARLPGMSRKTGDDR